MDPWAWTDTSSGCALLAAAADLADPTPAAVARLRRLGDADLVRRAIELADARRRAAGRLADAEHLLLDRAGAEMATSTDIARWKARRFVEFGARRVLDLCAGIGGDAIGLALAGIEPILVDRDRVRLIAARRNVALVLGHPPPALLADVATLPFSLLPFHLDPDRRAGGKRTWRYEELVPGPETIEELAASGAPGAVKLGPGVDLETLPTGEVEIIQRGGGLAQAVLWLGPLARGARRATRVDVAESFAAAPLPLPLAAGGPVGPYLHEVAPAIERAGLLGALARAHGLVAPHEHAGLLAGREPVRNPWLSPGRVLAEVPGRIDTVRRWLAERGSPRTIVRVRGGDDASDWERALRGEGEPALTVHVTRRGRRRLVWITAEV